MATEFCDIQLFAKLSSGDMTTINAVYHKQYLTAFYNKNCSVIKERRSAGISRSNVSLWLLPNWYPILKKIDKKNRNLNTFLNCQILYDYTDHNFSNLIAICQSVQTQLF